MLKYVDRMAIFHLLKKREIPLGSVEKQKSLHFYHSKNLFQDFLVGVYALGNSWFNMQMRDYFRFEQTFLNLLYSSLILQYSGIESLWHNHY